MIADELLRESLQIFDRLAPGGQLGAIREYQRKVEEYLRDFAEPVLQQPEVVIPAGTLEGITIREILEEISFDVRVQGDIAYLRRIVDNYSPLDPMRARIDRAKRYLGVLFTIVSPDPQMRRTVENIISNYKFNPSQWEQMVAECAPHIHRLVFPRI